MGRPGSSRRASERQQLRPYVASATYGRGPSKWGNQIKYQMPALVKRALMILPFAAVLGIGGWYTVFRDSSLAKASPSLAGDAGAQGEAARATTAESYVQSITPLVSNVPCSAPVFVGRTVVSDLSSPRLCDRINNARTNHLPRNRSLRVLPVRSRAGRQCKAR